MSSVRNVLLNLVFCTVVYDGLLLSILHSCFTVLYIKLVYEGSINNNMYNSIHFEEEVFLAYLSLTSHTSELIFSLTHSSVNFFTDLYSLSHTLICWHNWGSALSHVIHLLLYLHCNPFFCIKKLTCKLLTLHMHLFLVFSEAAEQTT